MARGLVVAAALLAAAVLVWLALDRRGDRPDTAARAEAGTTPDDDGEGVGEPVVPVSAPDGRAQRSVAGTAASEMPASREPRASVLDVVSGTAVDADGGAPIPGLLLAVGLEEDPVEVVTDDDGRFRVETEPLRGIVRFEHAPDGAPGPNRLYRRITPALLVADGTNDEALRDVVLRVHAPPEDLLIDVLDPAGRPAPDAEVSVFLEGEDEFGLAADRTLGAWTGEDGRCRLHVRGGRAPWSRLTVLATRGEEVSPSTTWNGPLRQGPYEVQLERGAAIDVTVLDGHDGPPYADIGVFASVRDDDSGQRRSFGGTDADGRLRLSPLAAGSYRVTAADLEVGRWVGGNVEVRSGEEVALTLTVPPGGPAQPLAAAGRVVDEAGLPLAGVKLLCLGGEWRHSWHSAWVETKDDGTFEWRAEEVEGVRIQPGLEEDRFEPPFAEIPFGTADLLFQRVREVVERRVLFLVRDAETGEELTGATVIHVVPGAFHNYVTDETHEGKVAFAVKLHEEGLLVTYAPGYRRDTRRVLDAVELRDDYAVCRVDLEKGFLREVQVLDDGLDEPVPGAALEHEGARIATTDERGRATVELAAWPREVTIRAAGYRQATWSPLEDVDYPEPAWIWISPRL